MIRSILTVLFLTFSLFSMSAQDIVESYIGSYQYIAVSEMERTGIPASIKLAQGLLESDWGRSELSSFAHNHFGIKCGSSWEGKGYYKVDDDYDKNGHLKESCFRVFESDDASYIAHSEFLLGNKRYAFLFDYSDTDYKSWAKGLKKAGYATDPKYPAKLIGIIKKYELSKFDNMASDELEILAKSSQLKTDEELFMEESMEDIGYSEAKVDDEVLWVENKKNNKKDKRQNSKTTKKSKADKFLDKFSKNMESFIEELQAIGDEVLNEPSQEVITSFPDLDQYNGVKMVLTESGETMGDVALRSGIRLSDLNEYNEGVYKRSHTFQKGTTLYIENKKNSFSGSRKIHHVRPGDTVVKISQQYAVTESSLRKRNYLTKNEEVKPGEMLYLRGIRTTKKPLTKRSLASNHIDNITTQEQIIHE